MPQVVPLIISGLGFANVIAATTAAWLTSASSIAVRARAVSTAGDSHAPSEAGEHFSRGRRPE